MAKFDPDSPSTPEATPAPAPKPDAARRWRPGRFLWRAWLALWLLVLLLLGTALALPLSAAGSRWLLEHAPGVTAQNPQGALAGPFQAQALRVALGAERTLVLNEPRWSGWHLSWGDIRLSTLHVQRLSIEGPPAPESKTPTVLPRRLVLPWSVRIEEARLDEISLPALGAHPIRDVQARLHLAGGASGEHGIELHQLHWDRWALQGKARLEAESPLRLKAAFLATPWAPPSTASTTTPASVPLPADSRLALEAEGPLADLKVGLTLQAAGQSLSAQAGVRAEETQPIQRLDSSFEALNLSALHSGWPTSSLTGHITARLQAPGADRQSAPLQVDVRLGNAAPGDWATGHLPFHRLLMTAHSHPEEPRRGTLEAFELALGRPDAPAGVVRGQGEWRALVSEAMQVQAELALDALEPARLLPQAPPLRLSGPLKISYSAPSSASNSVAPPATATPRLAVALPFLPSGAQIEANLDLAGRTTARWPQGPALDTPVSLQLQGRLDDRTLDLSTLQARAADARMQGQLRLRQIPTRQQTQWSAQGRIDLQRFDPAVWWPAAGRAGPSRVNARLNLDLQAPDAARSASGVDTVLRQLQGQANLQLQPSQVLGVTSAGDITLTRSNLSAPLQARAQLSAADTRLEASTRLEAGSMAQRTQMRLSSPALEKLNAWWRVVLPDWAPAGDLETDLQFAGRWPDWTTQGQLRSRTLTLGKQGQVQSLQGKWSLTSDPAAPLDLTLAADRGRWATHQLGRFALRGTGEVRRHQVTLDAQAVVGGAAAGTSRPQAAARPLTAVLKVDGGLTRSSDTLAWAGTLQQLEVRDPTPGHDAWNVRLGAPTALTFEQHSPEGRHRTQATVGAMAIEVAGARLRTEPARWSADGLQRRLAFKARLEPLAVAPLLSRLQPDFGWAGDLRLVGDIDVDATPERFRAQASVRRDQGDLMVMDAQSGRPAQVLGLDTLQLALDAQDGRWRFTQRVSGKDLGSLQGEQTVSAPVAAWVPPAQAPARGQLQLDVAELGRWGNWLPAGWRLSGKMQGQVGVGGTFGAPELSGTLEGSGMAVRNLLEGVNWSDARLRLVMRGDHARLEQFTMQAGSGRLQATGDVRLGADPSATLELRADRFAVLQRVDRRIVASGTAQLFLDGSVTRMEGRLRADEGRFDFSRSDAPSLGDDVNVKRNEGHGVSDATGSDPARPDRKLQLDVTANLGDEFRLTGRGLNTRLVGEVRLTSPNNKLAVNGEIRAAEGTYAAYAQKLSLERGIISFTGAPDNARLNILAIRPDLEDQVAGVSVTGTSQNPRIRLYSDPSLTDTETLSWLILGRAPDGLGRTDLALLQRAAFAMLAGEDSSPSIIERLGIDQFSVSQSDGDTRETVVSVGKQLSRRWFLGYERSLNAETGTWQLIYRIAKRFTVRGQSGAENALDVIWTWKWGTDQHPPSSP